MNSKISVLGFADDSVVLGEDAETIKLNTRILMNPGKEIGLEINSDKTKYMVSSRKGRNSGDIVVEGNKFEYVEKFKYLGSKVTRKNEIQEEIRARLKA